MKKTFLALAMIALLWLPATPYADTIYSWKGKDGTLKFSNEPPPDGVTKYQTTVSESTGANDQAPRNKRRTSYDAMVQKASSEADRSIEQREAVSLAEKKRIAEEQRKSRIQSERKQLEQQVEALKNRAVSRTYPNGMKQAQIDALNKEIEKLEDDGTAKGTKGDHPGENEKKSSVKN